MGAMGSRKKVKQPQADSTASKASNRQSWAHATTVASIWYWPKNGRFTYKYDVETTFLLQVPNHFSNFIVTQKT